MPPRQPLAARVWGPNYRTWWWAPGGRNKKKAKRRSARRERARAQREIRDGAAALSMAWLKYTSDPYGTGPAGSRENEVR